ncbi:MAG: hypothetical protein HY943_21135 [Gammaproteobacteria bacterium]|nr:hypothetical protein [Gammaproteobacteria bacterium]
MRLRYCYHEAGHVVVLLACGGELREVFMHGDGGKTRGIVREGRAARAYTAAGAVAEALCAGEPIPRSLDGCPEWRHDAKLLSDGVGLIFAPGTRDYSHAYRLSIESARAILRLHWSAARTIADALDRRGWLLGADVRRLVRIEPGDYLPDDPKPIDVQRCERLLADFNRRSRAWHAAQLPAHKRGNAMATSQIETATIGQAGAAGVDLQQRVIQRAHEVRARVLTGKLPEATTVAIAARNAIDLAARHGNLGLPLLAELARQLQVAA